MPTAPEPSAPPTPGISRRRALRVGGGGALALVLGGVAGWADRRGGGTEGAAEPAPTVAPSTTAAAPTSTPTTAPPVVLPDIGEIDPAIIALGRRVVETTGEDDPARLLAELPAGDGDPIARAATVVRDDFLAARTLTVDGWVLSASEARAAAVVALLCDGTSC